MFKLIRNSRRSRLTARNLDMLLRLSLNGPDILAEFPAHKYSREWYKRGRMLIDDQHNLPRKHRKRPLRLSGKSNPCGGQVDEEQNNLLGTSILF